MVARARWALALVLVLTAATSALAVPKLQLFIEGSTYDPATETWTFAGDDFTLWVLGYGTIDDVKLTAAFPSTETTGIITIVGTTADPSFLPSPDDPSPAPDPTVVLNPLSALSPSASCGTNGTNGTIPCFESGASLPPHGEYGPGTRWIEFLLGDFTLTDSPIGDFTQSLPDPSDPSQFPKSGQINAYDISVTGFTPGTTIHFDAFGTTKHFFAPFSHDALDQPTGQVPSPSTFILLGVALLTSWGYRHLTRRH